MLEAFPQLTAAAIERTLFDPGETLSAGMYRLCVVRIHKLPVQHPPRCRSRSDVTRNQPPSVTGMRESFNAVQNIFFNIGSLYLRYLPVFIIFHHRQSLSLKGRSGVANIL
jgi:hypothetical protein